MTKHRKDTRIKVLWMGDQAWSYYEKPEDAYNQVRGLMSCGFLDARIVWPVVKK